MMRVDGAELFPAPAVHAWRDRGGARSRVRRIQKLVDALMRLMADERIYRHDNVSIGTLATKLSIPEYRLRRLINQQLGYRNFNVFLNNHRIEEAKAALGRSHAGRGARHHHCHGRGLSSRSARSTAAFKATTGVTPTEYRRLNADRGLIA